MTCISKARGLAGILVLALALCATSAAARPLDVYSNGSPAPQTLPNPDQQTHASSDTVPHMTAFTGADTNAHATTAQPAAISAPTGDAPNGGFDWGDAAIGAAVTAAIALLIAVATPVVRQRGPAG